MGETLSWWQTLRPLWERGDPLTVFQDFALLSAASLHHPRRAAEFQSVRQRYAEADLMTFAAALGHLAFERLRDPLTDTLGPLYAELLRHSSRRPPVNLTPPPVALSLAALSFPQALFGAEGDLVPVTDPACGSGTLLMAAQRILNEQGRGQRLLVTAADHDPTAANLALLNLSFAGVRGSVTCAGVLWSTMPDLVETLVGPTRAALAGAAAHLKGAP